MSYTIYGFANGNVVNQQVETLDEASAIAEFFIQNNSRKTNFQIAVLGPKGRVWSYELPAKLVVS